VPPPELPAGPDFFRFAADAELAGLLTGAGLRDPVVVTLDWHAEVASSDELWHGFANGTVRTRALLVSQTPSVQTTIRDELARSLAPYRTGETFSVPVSVKLASAVR
jgi:hypothetical protein